MTITGIVATVTIGWAGYVARLSATIMHIEFLSCNLLDNIRLEGQEGNLRTALVDCRERGFVVRMAAGWSWLCCKDGRRMELAKL